MTAPGTASPEGARGYSINMLQVNLSQLSVQCRMKLHGHDCWLVDTGATHHVCGNADIFTARYLVSPYQVTTANGLLQGHHQGDVTLAFKGRKQIKWHHVLYWKDAPYILSISQLARQGFSFHQD